VKLMMKILQKHVGNVKGKTEYLNVVDAVERYFICRCKRSKRILKCLKDDLKPFTEVVVEMQSKAKVLNEDLRYYRVKK
jgi:hypothetical protein